MARDDLGLVAILIHEAVGRSGGVILSGDALATAEELDLVHMSHQQLCDALTSVLDETRSQIRLERASGETTT